VLGGWLWGAAAGLLLLSLLPAADRWAADRRPLE
jgi:hypothetical protein